jgi:hypothetical protein
MIIRIFSPLAFAVWPNHAMQLTPSARHASCLACQPQESRRAPGVADLLPLGQIRR